MSIFGKMGWPMYEQVAVPIFEKVKNAENIVLKF